MNNKNNKNKKGFAMLFTIVIVSAVSVITAGLTNAIYKQIILSSLARDSQIAFYQADTASDCALYADLVEYRNYASTTDDPKKESIFDNLNNNWSCGGLNLKIKLLEAASSLKDPSLSDGYTIEPETNDESSSKPCFKITVTKEITGNPEDSEEKRVVIKSKGYNLCDMTNSRTVEREIETDYNQ